MREMPKVTPNIVTDWEQSKHSKQNIDCAACHGDQHISAQDADDMREKAQAKKK